MNTGSQALTRSRGARVVGSVLAAVLLFAGCSAGSEDSGTSDYASARSDADWAGGGADDSWAMEEQALAEEGSAPRPISDNRSVIVTGALYITVEDPTAAAASAVKIVRDAGGRIDGRSETAANEYDGGSAWLTLRIPSDALDPTVAELRGLGTVDEYTTDSYDVTNEVTDLAAQISTLRASTARIESLLTEAQDISDIIKLETELAERQGTLEGLEARQRGLDDQVSMSTIDLSLTTEPVVLVQEEPPNSFLDGLASGWNGLVSFLSGTLVVVGVLLPWLVLGALITVAIIAAVRQGKKRKAGRLAATPQAAPVAAHTATAQAPDRATAAGATQTAQTPPEAPDVFTSPPSK